MNTMLEIITYGSFLVMAVVLGLALPFISDEAYQQLKTKRLAKKIADIKEYIQYDIKLLEILLNFVHNISYLNTRPALAKSSTFL